MLQSDAPDTPGAPDAASRTLQEAFSRSDAAGALELAVREVETTDAGLDWLKRFVRRWLGRVCQTRETAPPPDGEMELLSTLAAAPPMPGAEYLNADMLRRLWVDLGAVAEHAAAEHPQGLDGWLRAQNPVWHLVGRVTFHLAENKRDQEKPFAFLATYTDSVSAAGRLQHVPLGRAVQAYAAAKDEQVLARLLSPVREASEKSDWTKQMLETRRVFQAVAWSPHEAWQFVRESPLLEQCGIVVKVPDWWKGGRPSRPAVRVQLDNEGGQLNAHSLLSFRAGITIDGETLSKEELEKIRSSASGLINLRGKWVEIDRERLDQVMAHWEKVAAAHAGGGLSFHEGMRYLAGFDAGGARPAQEFTETLTDWSEVVAGKQLAAALEQMQSPESMRPPADLKATLRPYQEKGYGWLHFMRQLGLGACLADDMGLGKTLQVIALLTKHAAKGTAPSLLVVPASLLGNWRAECTRFAPKLRIFWCHPSQTDRTEMDRLLARPENLNVFDAVVTTYGRLQRSTTLMEFAWDAVILDEAQAIKNPGTAQTKAVKQTKARWRLAMTGTPVENRPTDLWSLFDFLNPGLLGGSKAFADAVKGMSAAQKGGYAPLRNLVRPYILRRLKTDKSVIADLPDKTEITAMCGLTKKQAVLYAKLVEQMKRDLEDPMLPPNQRSAIVVTFLMKFKQVCNHPSHWSGDGVYKPEDSGKFARLADLCQEIAERQERVLVFTQFREIIDALHDHLSGVFRRPGLILHGGTAVGKRQQLVEQFQQPGGPPFFLLSVKAGGTGLNLTAASHVIHFDRWWNPAVENQATDRAFRIGQKRNVLVHKFVCAGTVEERIHRVIEDKKQIAEELLGGSGGAEKLLTDMSTDELLRFVALDVNAAGLA